MFSIVFTPKAIKSLEKFPQNWRQKIWKALEGLKESPFRGKKLQGKLAGLYSFRVWPYRVIYLIKTNEIKIIVVYIGYRQSVYKS